jgi:hypothetical protein
MMPTPARRQRGTLRPIVFGRQAIGLIENGFQTQTRRLVRVPAGWQASHILQSSHPIVCCVPARRQSGDERSKELVCPYGRIGDLLWVKEAWRQRPGAVERDVEYRADYHPAELEREARAGDAPAWRSPLLMLPGDARFWLRIRGVRAQGIEAISNVDILAEGIQCPAHPRAICACEAQRARYRQHWNGIHREHPDRQMSKNPLVWAVTFELVG